MKKYGNKIIVILIVALLVFNALVPICQAKLVEAGADVIKALADEITMFDDQFSSLSGAIDGIVGLLTWKWRAPLAAVGMACNFIIGTFTGQDGVSPDMILFNDAEILDVNFFDFTGVKDQTVLEIRKSVATFYYAIRNIAIVMSLGILIYVAIRMAISTVASEKAQYKKMLIDWIVSFALIFLLNYIIVGVLTANQLLVEALKPSTTGGGMAGIPNALMAQAFGWSFIGGIASLIVYLGLIGVTIALFFMYVRRMLTTGFLIMIAPLITVTYSIDKMGDGKSQALNTWLKEFMVNVLIQPFHCIIYLSLVSVTMGLFNARSSILGASILAIASILFIFKAEGIVKKIFGLDKASMDGASTYGMLAVAAATKFGKLAENGKKATSGGSSGSSAPKTKTTPRPSSNHQRTTKAPGKFATSRVGQSRIGQAILDTKDDIKDKALDKLDDIKDGMRNLKDTPNKDLAKQFYGDHIKWDWGKAAKIGTTLAAGAMAAGATGDIEKGIAAGMVGANLGNSLKSHIDSKADMKRINTQREDLAAAYENYRAANPNLTKDQIKDRSEQLLHKKLDSIADENEKAYAEQLQNMQRLFASAGIKENEEATIHTVTSAQAGNIRNKVSSKVNPMIAAAKSYRQQSGADKAEINRVTKEILREVEKDPKYVSKIADETKRQYAQTVVNTKKILSAVGSSDHVDDRIINILNR